MRIAAAVVSAILALPVWAASPQLSLREESTFADPVLNLTRTVPLTPVGALGDAAGAWLYVDVVRGPKVVPGRLRVGRDGVPVPGSFAVLANVTSPWWFMAGGEPLVAWTARDFLHPFIAAPVRPDGEVDISMPISFDGERPRIVCNAVRCLHDYYDPSKNVLIDRSGAELRTISRPLLETPYAWPGGFLLATTRGSFALVSNEGEVVELARNEGTSAGAVDAVWDGNRFVVVLARQATAGVLAVQVWTVNPRLKEVRKAAEWRDAANEYEPTVYHASIVWNGAQYVIALELRPWVSYTYVPPLYVRALRLDANLLPFGLAEVSDVPIRSGSTRLAPVPGGAIVAWTSDQGSEARVALVGETGIVAPPAEANGRMLLRETVPIAPQVVLAGAANRDATLAVWSEQLGPETRLVCARTSPSGQRLDKTATILGTGGPIDWATAGADGVGFLIAWAQDDRVHLAYVARSGSIEAASPLQFEGTMGVGERPMLRYAGGTWQLAVLSRRDARPRAVAVTLSGLVPIRQRIVALESGTTLAVASDMDYVLSVSEDLQVPPVPDGKATSRDLIIRFDDLMTGGRRILRERIADGSQPRRAGLLRDLSGHWILFVDDGALSVRRITAAGEVETPPVVLPRSPDGCCTDVVSIGGVLYATATVHRAGSATMERLMRRLDFASLQPVEPSWTLLSMPVAPGLEAPDFFSAPADPRAVHFFSRPQPTPFGLTLQATAQEILLPVAPRTRPAR